MRTGKASINLSDRNKEKLDKDQLLTIIPKFAEYRTKVTTPVAREEEKHQLRKLLKRNN